MIFSMHFYGWFIPVFHDFPPNHLVTFENWLVRFLSLRCKKWGNSFSWSEISFSISQQQGPNLGIPKILWTLRNLLSENTCCALKKRKKTCFSFWEKSGLLYTKIPIDNLCRQTKLSWFFLSHCYLFADVIKHPEVVSGYKKLRKGSLCFLSLTKTTVLFVSEIVFSRKNTAT